MQVNEIDLDGCRFHETSPGLNLPGPAQPRHVDGHGSFRGGDYSLQLCQPVGGKGESHKAKAPHVLEVSAEERSVDRLRLLRSSCSTTWWIGHSRLM